MNNKFTEIKFDKPVNPDYVFFHSTTKGSFEIQFDKNKFKIYQELIPSKKRIQNPTYNKLCRSLLIEISKRKVPSNYSWFAKRWGNKKIFEKLCREYELKTEKNIPRPITKIVEYPQDKELIKKFTLKHDFCILKPSSKNGASGLSIINSKSILDESIKSGTYVMQELISNPILVNGKKIDIRIFLIISDIYRQKFKISSLVFVRYALKPYKRGDINSEICSNSYSKKLGHVPIFKLLDEVESESKERIDWLRVRIEIKKIIDHLMDGVAYYSQTKDFFPCKLL